MQSRQDFRGGISSVGHQIKGNARQLDRDGAWILSGSANPSEAAPNGSLYLQTGSGGLWLRSRDSWAPVAVAVDGGGR